MMWKSSSAVALATGILIANPAAASQTVEQAVDITNQERPFTATLDEHGQTEAAVWISVRGTCRFSVVPAHGTGFTVGYRLESVNGTRIFGSLQGTQGRDRGVMIGEGRYRFVAYTHRGAGYYEFRLVTHCT